MTALSLLVRPHPVTNFWHVFEVCSHVGVVLREQSIALGVFVNEPSVVANVDICLRMSVVPQRVQVTGGCSARRGTSCSNRSLQRAPLYEYWGMVKLPLLQQVALLAALVA